MMMYIEVFTVSFTDLIEN